MEKETVKTSKKREYTGTVVGNKMTGTVRVQIGRASCRERV